MILFAMVLVFAAGWLTGWASEGWWRTQFTRPHARRGVASAAKERGAQAET